MHKISYLLILVVLFYSSCTKRDRINSSDTEYHTESSYIKIDWNSIEYSFDSGSGDIILPINSISSINEFSTVILPENPGAHYNPIRVINNIKKEKDFVVLHTSDGTLENLFINQSFTLSIGNTDSYQVKSNNTIYPSKVEVIYKSATKASNSNNISYRFNQDEIEILPGEISLSAFQSSIDAALSLYFEFGEKKEKNHKIGDLKDAQIFVSGDFSLESIVSFLKTSVGFSHNIDITPIGARFEFLVGLVPIIVTISPNITFYGESEMEEKLTINSHMKGTIGYHWKNGEDDEYVNDFEAVSHLWPITTHQETNCCNIGANFNLDISFYESLSFSIGYGPRFSNDIKRREVSIGYYGYSNNRYVDWGLNIDIDFSILKHLDIPLLKVFKPLSTNIVFISPSTIQIENDPKTNLKKGQSMVVSFKVTGIDSEDKIPTPNSLVHFIAMNGNIDKEYAYTDKDGIVSVSYSLNSEKNGSLSVELIGGEGEVVDSIYDIKFCYDDEETPYTPTEEDCIIYYTREKGTSFSDVFNTETIWGRTVLSQSDYSSEDIPSDEIGGKVVLDGPVISIQPGSVSSWGIKYLKSLRIPMSCKVIGDAAFFCSSVERVDIQSADIIGTAAFIRSELKSVIFGNGVKEIGLSAFSLCNNIEQVPIFNEGLKRIGNFAFSNCSLMKGTPSFPASIRTIGDFAFGDCSCLEGTLTIPQTIDTLGHGAFNNCTGLTKIYVPQKFKEQYDKRYKEDVSYHGFEDTVFKNCKAFIVYY